ncbi:hypothetical protein [Domibacillus robiginosus]|uniref:hypothetical protein n=1 Tax=Domibacillus robiginosus TaxID=1071054 RepID=UPI00067C1284|nr:hypothetical protein [Domibacillus robiginosus]
MIFAIIAGLISMLFNKKEKQETTKPNKQQAERKAKDLTRRLEEQKAKAQAAMETESRQPHIQKAARADEKPSRPVRASRIKKQESISVIDTWTGEDMVKGIVLSEILGPPKSKRKK